MLDGTTCAWLTRQEQKILSSRFEDFCATFGAEDETVGLGSQAERNGTLSTDRRRRRGAEPSQSSERHAYACVFDVRGSTWIV